MLKYNYSFELQRDLSELKVLCEHLINFGQITGLSKDCITEMNICLDEAFTNIVSYGFTDDMEHLIKFTIDWDNDVLILRVEDDGIPFNPTLKVTRHDFHALIVGADTAKALCHSDKCSGNRSIIHNIDYIKKSYWYRADFPA